MPRIQGFAELLSERIEKAKRDRRESGRAAFEAVADSLPSIVWTARPDGRIGFFNRAYGEFTGNPLLDWTEAVHPDDLPLVQMAWVSAVESGTNHEARFRCKHYAGAYHWVVARARPVRDHEGVIQYWIGSAVAIADESTVALTAVA